MKKCPNCKAENTASAWNLHTSEIVTGVPDAPYMGDIETADEGFFICPSCDFQFDISEID